MESEEGRRATDDELLERAEHAASRVLTVDVVHDELRDERVVEIRDLVTRTNSGVDANADSAWLAIRRDPSRRWEEPRTTSSALMRHSIAWPRSTTSSCATESGSPAATRICSRTMSIPVTASVTVCSTWTRVFISRKNSRRRSSSSPSIVPADR